MARTLKIPGSWFFSIPDQTRRKKFFFVFLAWILQNWICFELYRKKFEPNDKELKYYHPKCCYQALRNVVFNPGLKKRLTETNPPICFSTEWKELERVLSSTEQHQEDREYIKAWTFLLLWWCAEWVLKYGRQKCTCLENERPAKLFD